MNKSPKKRIKAETEYLLTLEHERRVVMSRHGLGAMLLENQEAADHFRLKGRRARTNKAVNMISASMYRERAETLAAIIGGDYEAQKAEVKRLDGEIRRTEERLKAAQGEGVTEVIRKAGAPTKRAVATAVATSGHTEGPLEVQVLDDGGFRIVKRDHGGFPDGRDCLESVAEISGRWASQEESKAANAILFAAAPDLLQMLAKIANAEFGFGEWPKEADIKNLIMKATGQ